MGRPDDEVTALFRLHFWGLVRLAAQLVGDQASAEDVVQEAFVRLHRRWLALRDEDAALDYLRSTVLNLSRSRLRHLAVRRRREPVTFEGALPSADETAEANAAADRVLAALRRLPRRQREVLVLRYYLDLSEAQIAATLGISAGSVKTHASRGLRALDGLLGGEA